jgi:large subunit ribosomal protein L22
MSKEYMQENREELLKTHSTQHPKSHKPALLTKKERKTLGIGRDEGRAVARYVRLSARKANIVIALIKDKSLDEALAILKYTPKAASPVLEKLLKSAEANAVNNNNLTRDALYVSDCFANQGPTLKRIMPRARGSASKIHKRTSHITLVLKERK